MKALMKGSTSNVLMICLFIALSAQSAFASGSGMPWESPLQQIVDSVSGPVAKLLGVGAIVVTGLTLSAGEVGGGFKRLLQVAFGLSIAFAASTFFISFFGFAGGASF